MENNNCILNCDINSLNFYNENYTPIFLFGQKTINGGFETIDVINNTIKKNSKHYFVDSKNRCRFCNKMEPDVTFKNKAHAFPESLGNKLFINKNFECDSCNSFFGNKYEIDLERFLHHILVMNGIKGKNGIKKYRTKDGTSRFEYCDNIIKIKELDIENIFIDKKKKELIYIFNIEKYSIINVYKILLKMALSALPENEIKNYQIALSTLKNEKLIGYEYIGTCFFPGFNRFEFYTMGYKLKSIESDLPTYQFSILNGNCLFQIPVFCDKYIKNNNNRRIDINPCLMPTPFDNSNLGSRKMNIIKVDKNYNPDKNVKVIFKFDKMEGL